MKNRNASAMLMIIALGVIIFASCTHKPINFGDIIISETCDPDTAYFQNEVFPIINSNCAQSGCHSAASHQEGVDLSSWEAIYYGGTVKPGNASESKMYKVITGGEESMPPDYNLTSQQIATIQLWINQGALNNQCLDACDTTNVTFSGSIFPLISANCMGCHSGASPSGGIALENYNDIKAVAVNGKLYGSVSQTAGYASMPPGSRLLTCQIDMIRIWIDGGSLNN